ncbi:hypothetical protein CONCODRAFT_79608 [Conidiobolus coronatus NRRL 28638]|uniref:G-protein coupled receptors family 1 profile domain-containing protein n=1 Tax=Conidiobolus coronatus (strain ATCC 28846 / CBS 209.66 / NRRL 28638) TaxID=796925 RepID=A0A137P1X7_CONC2|nr:hypothetical protein CONCODRAFT_79608 [Conidiobolus coronatus NRRL 28638]|eukprot:KXN68884.1 hypothetical protein CONCODRAFT_79608 [Conidiobolus coronatus NRRL 28638]
MSVEVPTVIQYLGLVCSVVVILILAALTIVDIKLVNRVTVRLVAGIAIADFIGHVSVILILDSVNYIPSSYCQGLAAMTTLARLMYALTNVAICYHLYRVVVSLKKASFKYELAIWSVLMLIIGVIMVIFHFVGKLCIPGSDNFGIQVLENIIAGLFNLAAVASGIFTTFACHRHMNRWVEAYFNKDSEGEGDNGQNEAKVIKSKQVKRSFLYPLSTIITLSTELVTCFWSLGGNQHKLSEL